MISRLLLAQKILPQPAALHAFQSQLPCVSLVTRQSSANFQVRRQSQFLLTVRHYWRLSRGTPGPASERVNKLQVLGLLHRYYQTGAQEVEPWPFSSSAIEEVHQCLLLSPAYPCSIHGVMHLAHTAGPDASFLMVHITSRLAS